MLMQTIKFKQLWLAIATSLAYLGVGLTRGFAAPAVPSMRLLAPHLVPSEEAVSWIGAGSSLGALFGCLLAGPLMHRFGRRRIVMLVSPIWAATWCLVASSSSTEMLVISRVLTGLQSGLMIPAAQVYVSESCSTSIRGILGSLPATFMSGGILISFLLGSYLPWNYLAWTDAAFVGFIFFAIAPLPESPVWLTAAGRYDEASKAREWLQLDKISDQNIEIADAMKSCAANNEESPLSRKAFFRKPVLQPLGIGLGVLAFQQLSGIDTVVNFSVDIFSKSGSFLDSNLASVIIASMQFICNALSIVFIDKAGRKPLLLISGSLMSISMACMGSAFYLNDVGDSRLGFLPLASLVLYIVGFSLGFGCIPFLLIGELFPAAQRSVLSAIAGSFSISVAFIVIKTYHILQSLITSAGTFWMYSCFSIVSIVFVLFVVPETKGKSLEQIEKYFAPKEVIPNPTATPAREAEPGRATKF